MQNTEEFLSNPLVREALGGIGGVVRFTFNCADVASREIEKAVLRARTPELRRRVRESFPLLQPSGFATFAIGVYRHHAVELLDRIVRGEDTRPATCAEVLVALSEASLRAPPGTLDSCLAAWLFERVCPDHEHPEAIAEPWAGSREERLRELRRKLRKDERVLARGAA